MVPSYNGLGCGSHAILGGLTSKLRGRNRALTGIEPPLADGEVAHELHRPLRLPLMGLALI